MHKCFAAGNMNQQNASHSPMAYMEVQFKNQLDERNRDREWECE